MQAEALRGLVASADSPAACLQDARDVGALDVLERAGREGRRRRGRRAALAARVERVVKHQRCAAREDHSAFDDVAQLANVAGPGMGDEPLHRRASTRCR